MIHEQASVLGVVIAIGYIAAIGSIIRWMLTIPKAGDIEQQVRRVEREFRAFKRIVVPVQGEVVSDKYIALASQMAKYRGATMDVVYVIEVPLHLPIGAIDDEQMKRANDAFARAAKIAARFDVKIQRHVQRARQAGPAIVQYAKESGADFVIMGDVAKSNHRGTRYARSVEYVLENAPCEVIIDRPAPRSELEGSRAAL